MWMASVTKAKLLAKILPTISTIIYKEVSTITATNLDLFWEVIDTNRMYTFIFYKNIDLEFFIIAMSIENYGT